MEATEPTPSKGRARSLWRWCREHPVTPILVAGGATAGAWSAVAFELGDLADWQRLLGGALAGAWMATFALGFRLFD
jgi:hypothetical protein